METELDGWPLITTGNLQSSPALSDLDDDGDVELCIGSLRTRDGDEIINGSVYVWDLEGEFYPPTIEWSMFQANPAHNWYLHEKYAAAWQISPIHWQTQIN